MQPEEIQKGKPYRTKLDLHPNGDPSKRLPAGSGVKAVTDGNPNGFTAKTVKDSTEFPCHHGWVSPY